MIGFAQDQQIVDVNDKASIAESESCECQYFLR